MSRTGLSLLRCPVYTAVIGTQAIRQLPMLVERAGPAPVIDLDLYEAVSRAVRQNRRSVRETMPAAWLRHAAYLLFVIGAYPFAIVESAVGRGATVMIALPSLPRRR